MRRFFAAFLPVMGQDPLVVVHNQQEMQSRSIHGTFLISFAQILKFIIQFASQIILARLLLPDDFGLNAMIYPILGIIFVFNEVGLSQMLILREHLDREFVSSLFWLNLLIGTIIAAIIIVIAPVAAWFFNEPRLTWLIIVTGLCVPLGAIGAPPSALLGRQMRYGVGAVVGVFTAFLGFLATVAAAWSGWSYWSFVIGQVCMTITSIALVWIAVGWAPSAPKINKSAWAALSFGGNMTGANLANYLTTSGDNAIIAYAFGSHALGLYDRSYRLVVQPVGQLLAPIGTTAVPLLARLRDDPAKYQQTYLAMLYTIVFSTVPGMAACAVFPREVIEVFLGPRWLEAAPIFALISVGGLVSAIYASTIWLFLSQERVGELMRVTLVSSIINIAAYLIGARYGIYDVALGAVISFVCINLPLVFFTVLRAGPLSASRIFRTLAYQYAFVGVAVLLLVQMARHISWPPSIIVLAALLVSYGVSACGVILSKEQRDVFIKIARSIPFFKKRR